MKKTVRRDKDATDKSNKAGFRMDREKSGIRNFEPATQSGNGRRIANSGLSRDTGRQSETFVNRVDKHPARTYHVISHTHWDREWYEPFEVFRHQLVKMIDYLLEIVERDPKFRFHLDCQTIVLEDYLAIRPERKELLCRCIHQGNILVGPWYMQNDFYTSNGESTIRSLLTGTKLARDFGYEGDFIGYAPDHGGLPAQIPQIFRGFGIPGVIFGRGRKTTKESGKKNLFWFEGADGSRILGIHLFNFYNNAQRFSADEKKAQDYFRYVLEHEEWGNATGEFLLMNGVDHLFPQEDLEISLQAIRKILPRGDRIIQSSLPDYLAAQLKAVKGGKLELHHGEVNVPVSERLLMPGTYSGRIGQKSEITEAENRLYVRLQGLCAMLVMAGFSPKEYDRGLLTYLWKLLAENLAHDSSWGCSCDAVHRHIADRLLRFRELADALEREKLKLLSDHTALPARKGNKGKGYRLTVVNPLPWPRKGAVIRGALDIAQKDELGTFRLRDADGRELACVIESEEQTERALRSPVNLPGRIDVVRRKICFTADLPAYGYAVFSVEPVRGNAAPVQAKTGKTGADNGLLKVTVFADGKVDLKDLRNGNTFRNLLWIEDRGDLGDAYNFKPVPGERPVTTLDQPAKSVQMFQTAYETRWKIRYSLAVPAGNNQKRTARRQGDLRHLPLTVTLRLRQGRPELAVEIAGDNQADDHFLRAVIHTGFRKQELSQSTGMFEMAVRDRREPEDPNWKDREKYTRDFVRLCDREKRQGLAICTGTLHSFEHLPDRPGAEGSVALGIVRGNRYILGYYETPKDKTWIVPENEQRGEFHAAFALCPDDGSAAALTGALRAAQEFTQPPMMYADSCDPKTFAGGRLCVQDTSVTEVFQLPDPYEKMPLLPASASFFDLGEDAALLLSTVKAPENGAPGETVFRFWNPLPDRAQDWEARLPEQVRSLEKIAPDERRVLETLRRKRSGRWTGIAAKAEILTLKLSQNQN